MAFSKSIRTAFVVQSVDTSGKSTDKLVPFQLGVVGSKWTTLSSPDPINDRSITIAVGSPNRGQVQSTGKPTNFANQGNVNLSFKSQPIVNVTKAFVSKPVAVAKPYVGYLGNDNLNNCLDIAIKCGKNFALSINLEGRGVRSVYGQDIHEIIEIPAVACSDCAADCTDAAVSSKFIDQLVANVNDSFQVGRFVKAEKIQNCCPALAAPTTIAYTNYALSLCDGGEVTDLAAVQAQYPTVSISRIDRVGTTSKYGFCQLAATAAPAAYSQTGTVIANCATCPAGFTTVTGGQVRLITIDNTNADLTPSAWLTEVQTKYATAIKATKLSFVSGTSTYTVILPSNFTVPGTIPTETTISDLIGTEPTRCVQTSPTTTAWVTNGAAYKVKRRVYMTMSNSDCNATVTDLSRIQAAYANMPNLVAGSITLDATDTNTCKSRYYLEQYNNDCLVDGCDTIALAKFDPIPAFEGHVWGDSDCQGWTTDGNGCLVPPVDTVVNCKFGIKFTTSFINPTTGGCSFDPGDARFYEPVRIQATLLDLDYGSVPLGTPFRITQAPVYEQLSGQEVLRDIILSRMYRKEPYFSPSQEYGGKYNAAEGLEYGVDVNKHYFAIHLFHNDRGVMNYTASNNDLQEEIVIYIAEDNLTALDSTLVLLNTWLTKKSMAPIALQ